MMRSKTMRNELIRMLRQQPYQPVEINIENGDRLVVEHPENIRVQPRPKKPQTSQCKPIIHVVNGDVMYGEYF